MQRKRMESAADLATSIGNFYVKAFTQPMTALGGSLAASQEMLKSLVGQSGIEPDKSDKRFKDPVWTSNPGYRFLMQSYLGWAGAITQWIDGLDVPARDKLRVKLLANLVTDALAPTNALLTNPVAMKATLDAGGKNLVAGLQHFMHDMTANNGLPSMVDKSKFRFELRGFGAFTVKQRPARIGRNPRTGVTVQVDEKTVPYFKAGGEILHRLNRGLDAVPLRRDEQ